MDIKNVVNWRISMVSFILITWKCFILNGLFISSGNNVGECDVAKVGVSLRVLIGG